MWIYTSIFMFYNGALFCTLALIFSCLLFTLYLTHMHFTIDCNRVEKLAFYDHMAFTLVKYLNWSLFVWRMDTFSQLLGYNPRYNEDSKIILNLELRIWIQIMDMTDVLGTYMYGIGLVKKLEKQAKCCYVSWDVKFLGLHLIYVTYIQSLIFEHTCPLDWVYETRSNQVYSHTIKIGRTCWLH